MEICRSVQEDVVVEVEGNLSTNNLEDLRNTIENWDELLEANLLFIYLNKSCRFFL